MKKKYYIYYGATVPFACAEFPTWLAAVAGMKRFIDANIPIHSVSKAVPNDES